MAAALCVIILLLLAVTLSANLRQSGQPVPGSANFGEADHSAVNDRESAPRLVSNLNDIDFGTVKIGKNSHRQLVLTNSSSDNIAIAVNSNVLVEPDAFVFASDFQKPRSLPAGDSLVIKLRFTPQAAGQFSGELYVSHDGASGLDVYTLSGSGALEGTSAPVLEGALPLDSAEQNDRDNENNANEAIRATDSAPVIAGKQGDDNVLFIEAEDFSSKNDAAGHDWTPGARDGSSGGSMVSIPDDGVLKPESHGSPNMSYEVSFPDAGKWYVWVRGWGDTFDGEGKSDSLHVGINGKLADAKAIQGFPTGGWAWSNSTRSTNSLAIVLVDNPGQHMIDVWMREDGLEIDALLLTTDPDYVPIDSVSVIE